MIDQEAKEFAHDYEREVTGQSLKEVGEMKTKVKINELTFELTLSDEPDTPPVLEVENDSSMLLVNIELAKAIELNKLLNQFIQRSHGI